jgi:hypothetical protein
MKYASRILFLLGFLFVFLPCVATSASLTGREVMEKVINRDNGDHKTSDMEMVLIDKRGSQRVRKMRGYSREFEQGRYSILFFLEPSDVKNTGFLTHDYKNSEKDDDQWLYLPALRKTKRIAGGDQSGSFMGSDFNYSDMTEVDIADFKYRIMKEPLVEGVKTWQIEAIPNDDDVAADIGYSKSIFFVRQDNYVAVRSVLWVHKSKRRKFMKVEKLEQIDGIWVVLESQMTTKEGKTTVHSTYLRNSNIRFNRNLGEEIFAVRQLEKGLPGL